MFPNLQLISSCLNWHGDLLQVLFFQNLHVLFFLCIETLLWWDSDFCKCNLRCSLFNALNLQILHSNIVSLTFPCVTSRWVLSQSGDLNALEQMSHLFFVSPESILLMGVTGAGTASEAGLVFLNPWALL